MYEVARFYRVVSFGTPKGPWRHDRLQARRDAIALGLGSYDEWGTYFSTVPGEIQRIEIAASELIAAHASILIIDKEQAA